MNQYETQIDKSGISPISKFSYLKELLAPKAPALIDGLPFTTEGYERAKVILKSNFGKFSEVAKAHIENVISLPVINNSNPGRIHSFYEKLVTSVQFLESLGKLQNINGFVRHTLDKLSGIRSELVRSDDDWQEWTYVELVEALKKWTERNPVQSTEKSTENNPKRERGLISTQGETSLNITLSKIESFIPKKVLPSLKGVYTARVTISLRGVTIFSIQMRGRKF